jgi:hypothetical protein
MTLSWVGCQQELGGFWSLDRFTREGARETLQYLDQLMVWAFDHSPSGTWIPAGCLRMLALGIVMAVEKNLPWGRRFSAPLGVVLIAAGVAVIGIG